MLDCSFALPKTMYGILLCGSVAEANLENTEKTARMYLQGIFFQHKRHSWIEMGQMLDCLSVVELFICGSGNRIV